MTELTWRVHRLFRLAAVAGLAVAWTGCAPKASSGPAALPPAHSVSGTVSGAAVAGVTVTIQGGSKRATTDALGRYSIGGLYDGIYTLEASLDGYSFTPPTRAVTVSGANVPGQDFTSQAGIAIAGNVIGPPGVTVTLAGPAPATTTLTATTDAAGSYRFPNVASGVYLVTPSYGAGWTFSPANSLVTVARASLAGPDFVSIPPTHGLSGRVTGAFTAGVVVTLSGGGAAVAVTDAAGSYTFKDLLPGSYVVTPSRPGFAFTPESRTATLATADVTGQDFSSAATHKIAGRIAGAVLKGVTVSLSGAATGEVTTDPSGYFELPGLVDGSYLVTPSLAGYTFGPASQPVTLSGADVTTLAFTASGLPSYTVSGSVSGAVLAGVTVTLEGATTSVTTTDAAGAFRFEGVAPGSYLLVPYHDDYTFDPASRFVVVDSADVAGQAFTAALSPSARIIAGGVSGLEGVAAAAVTVTLVGPSPATTARAVTTDGAGAFQFSGLSDGQYLATPSLAGFAFIPANCLVTVAGPSVTYVEFLSVHVPHAISGRLSGALTAGVPVVLGQYGSFFASTVTAADGSYAFTGLFNGDYTVTPGFPHYAFSPVEATVTIDGADVAGVNFSSSATHTISGYVSGDATADVLVKLTGAVQAEAKTDATGHFAFLDLPDGGYLLTPSLDGYTFDPQLLPLALAGADLGADFTATRIPTFAVTGTISGIVVGGITVQLTGATTASTTTDPAGGYGFSGLPAGSYMVTPSLPAFVLTPASRAFRISGADVAGQDFTSAVAP